MEVLASLCRDEVELVDSFCSGRRSCLLPVATFVEKNIDPCPNVPKELKSYLTVGYHCEAGVALVLRVQDTHALRGGAGQNVPPVAIHVIHHVKHHRRL